jgi:hypothetical protein
MSRGSRTCSPAGLERPVGRHIPFEYDIVLAHQVRQVTEAFHDLAGIVLSSR